MDRRPLAVLLAVGLMGAAPAGAAAASADALLAQADTGTLSNAPTADLFAQTPKGTLSKTPTTSGARSSSRSGGSSSGSTSASAPAAATATTLPFTGSDPRVTLLLGIAAVLLGAGLRLRTGDARDF